MQQITGTKSVDFKITAKGHGVVNNNGPTTVMNEGKTVDNHTMPKLRGYTNLSGKVKDETGYKYKKEATDINFSETQLYISQNCIRHHLFKDQAYDLHFVNTKNINKLLASATGLLRGFVIPDSQNKRTSPLLVEDFIDQLGNGNFEQMGRSGSKEKTLNKKGEEKSASFYSKTTFGDTEYIAYGSISIEQLQFIALDNKFDRAAMVIKENQGEAIAQQIEDYIASLKTEATNNLTPKAVFHNNYVRMGTIFDEGEAGVLLNDDAIQLLVNEMLNRIENLVIRQAKGYMYVDDITVDYNTGRMMRIKEDSKSINQNNDNIKYAVYFAAK